ncbi:MAG: hypothetical protein ACRC0V_03135, partial [Fusobacteriaceae bacterium]
MKKLLVILMVVFGISSYADYYAYEMKEQKAEMVIYDTLSFIQDGNNRVDIWDVSVDYRPNGADVEIDVASSSRISKPALDAYAKKVANAVRKSFGNNFPVYISIGYDDAPFDA